MILLLLCLLAMPGCRRTAADSSSAPENETITEMEEKFGMPVVRVLVDVPNDMRGIRSNQLRRALETLPGFETDFMIYEESLEPSGVDRENAMTRLKTEIMAGKGPDLFLCGQDMIGLCGRLDVQIDETNPQQPFFTFPEKAMKNRVFLPLDSYIENAEYMEWDKFLPVIMEAGRNNEGQQLVPMGYVFDAQYADKEKYCGAEHPKTWEEMAQSGAPAVRYAVDCGQANFVGRVMEPATDEPLFTEEEFQKYMYDYFYTLSGLRSEAFVWRQEDEAIYKGPLVRTNADSSLYEPWKLGKDSPDYCVIPARNVRGGVTANIVAFAAINRNARYPDQAFRIIDRLMSTDIQQDSSFYRDRVWGTPVHMDIGSEEYPIDKNWYMGENNFNAFREARDEITEVRFPGPVDSAVNDTWAPTQEGLEKMAHEKYVLIKMLLAES